MTKHQEYISWNYSMYLEIMLSNNMICLRKKLIKLLETCFFSLDTWPKLNVYKVTPWWRTYDTVNVIWMFLDVRFKLWIQCAAYTIVFMIPGSFVCKICQFCSNYWNFGCFFILLTVNLLIVINLYLHNRQNLWEKNIFCITLFPFLLWHG